MIITRLGFYYPVKVTSQFIQNIHINHQNVVIM